MSESEITCSRAAEDAVIGIVLQMGEQCSDAFALDVRDFTDGFNRAVWSAVLKMHAAKKPIDIVTLSGECPSLDDLQMAQRMSCALVSTAQLPYYVELLKKMTARRDFISLARRITSEAEAEEFDPAALSERIRLYLKKAVSSAGEETAITNDLIEMYESLFKPPEEGQGIRLGMKVLDELIDGLKPSRLYVVGARPSVGKTVFGIHAAVRCAQEGRCVLIINREMEKSDILKRMSAMLGEVPMENLEKRTLDETQQEAMADMLGVLGNMPIHISNNARTPAEIRAAAMEIHEKQPLGLIVVDYLQRIHSGEKHRTRDEEIGAISFALKDLAMDLQVPVLLLSQLNRTAANMRPTMAMLRESGNIEQDADVIVLLHLPDDEDVPSFAKRQLRTAREQGGKYMEMIVDKNRHGQSGMTAVCFIGSRMRYLPFA